MGGFRDFTGRHVQRPDRNVDDDAPRAMRQELVDLMFHLVNQSAGQIQERRIYEVTGLMLGAGITANPYGGYLARVSRDVGAAEWPRVYDWISRLWPEFEQTGLHVLYREGRGLCDALRQQGAHRASMGHPQNLLARGVWAERPIVRVRRRCRANPSDSAQGKRPPFDVAQDLRRRCN